MPRLAQSRAPLWLSLACAAVACKGPPPDQVRVELPELVVSPDPVHATVYARRAGGSSPTTEKMNLSVNPADVAVATRDRNLFCKKSGDVKVTVDIQGVRGSANVKCRLVDRIEVGNLPVFDLTKPPVVLPVRALSKSGVAFDDVPITLTTDSPRVASVSGQTLTPLAVGETTATVRAGARTKVFPVRVVRGVKAEALPLEGGRRIYYGLPEGKYEVDVELLSEHKLTIEWRGAPYCTYSGYGRSHIANCVLQGKGGAVVDNPAFVMSGATIVTGAGISIREVP